MFRHDSFKHKRLEPEQVRVKRNVPTVPEKLFTKCNGCRKMILNSDLESNYGVCPLCGKHFRISARRRIALVADEGSFTEWDAELTTRDMLEFPGYKEKLESSRINSGEKEAAITGQARIESVPCAICAMEPDFMMGSMGAVVGEKVTRLFERATEARLPVFIFTVSGGARMHEGIISLMQMAKTSGAVKRHSDAGLLYIAVLTDPTTGGVTASFAMEGDIIIAEPDALIGFAGPRVIEQTIRQKLPPGFQHAEFLLEKGFIDMVVPRGELKKTIGQILSLHGGSV
jgi:acetyl-CoA carboxylase carboxyl transferase beta subunit